jgi:hypothetical protein
VSALSWGSCTFINPAFINLIIEIENICPILCEKVLKMEM